MSGTTPSSGGRDRRALAGLNHAGSAENRGGNPVEPWIGQCMVRINALSQREQDVLRLLGRGLENRAIAKALGIAERTVKQHVTRILTKLGCQSRLQAGLVAFAAHSVAGVHPSTPLVPRSGLGRSGESGQTTRRRLEPGDGRPVATPDLTKLDDVGFAALLKRPARMPPRCRPRRFPRPPGNARGPSQGFRTVRANRILSALPVAEPGKLAPRCCGRAL